jgi:hypothetical protein
VNTPRCHVVWGFHYEHDCSLALDEHWLPWAHECVCGDEHHDDIEYSRGRKVVDVKTDLL